ncbi:MAG: efflux RND transporter periplasmic adaptor subunit [Acidobacteriota bacterium]|jgi:RND family efflux transporter MFP subunit
MRLIAGAWIRSAAFVVPALVVAVAMIPVRGQNAAAVRYTEAVELPVGPTIRLSGSVEARQVSLVASDVAGKVDDFVAREGTAVRRGEPLVRLDTAQLLLMRAAGRAQLAEAEARLELAERNLTRSRDLFDEEVLPRQDLDNAVSEFHAWQGRVEASRAGLQSIELDLERSVIRAPFAGTVVEERCEVGEWVERGAEVVSLLSLDDLEVRVEVPEQYFDGLDRAAEPIVTFEALPGLQVEGKVRAIIPRADAQARTFPVTIGIPSAGGRIAAGMLAAVTLPAGESVQATVVPKDALVSQGPQRFVFRINDDDTVEMTPVEAGAGVGSWIVIHGDVRPGQRVVTRGNERLMPGQPVRGEVQEYALP